MEKRQDCKNVTDKNKNEDDLDEVRWDSGQYRYWLC